MVKNKTLVSAEEQSKISRVLLSLLNKYPDKPVTFINYEYLGTETGMAISTIQGAYKIRQYIDGGYRAQYQFKVLYRLQPANNDERLDAEELVNNIGAWLSANADSVDIGENAKVLSVSRDTVAALYARYEGGVEDYQILMNLVYEVNV